MNTESKRSPLLVMLCIVAVMAVFLTGCFIYSLNPLYKVEDLFANDLLLGEWTEPDSTRWSFGYATDPGQSLGAQTDSTCYYVTVKPYGEEWIAKTFEVRLVRLGKYYFADFFLNNYFNSRSVDIFDMHMLPVHTFARVSISGETVEFEWLNPDWAHREFNGRIPGLKCMIADDYLLVTSATSQLQRFAKKYAASEEAYSEGFSVSLTRKVQY
jgi:hypothetical protein